MKAPVSRSPEVVTRRILDAAQAEFMLHGYESASTNRITELFGGSKATLFRYYPTKESLLEGVVRRVAAQWHDAVDWRGIPDGSVEEWLVAFGTRTLEWILGEDPIFIGRLGISEGHKFPKLEKAFQETATTPLQAALSGQLRQWVKGGLIYSKDCRRDSERFLDLVISGVVSRRLYGARLLSGARLRTHVTGAVALFLYGCSTSPKAE